MTHIEQAIKEAVEKGGWKPNHLARVYKFPSGAALVSENAFTDPLFWQALGKARGWKEDWGIGRSQPMDDVIGKLWQRNCTRYHWHRFIDHLAEGKDAESFFKSLNHL